MFNEFGTLALPIAEQKMDISIDVRMNCTLSLPIAEQKRDIAIDAR